MSSVSAKSDKVLELAGIALADLVVLVSVQQYVPTLHLSQTSFSSGGRQPATCSRVKMTGVFA